MSAVSNKLITLVTGANQGIGYQAARKLAASGKYHVLLGARDLSKGQKAAESIASENAEALLLDVDSDASIKAAAETVEKKFGRLDILVNNAGINGFHLSQSTLREQFQGVFNTNVFGAAVVTDTFLPLLKKSTAEGGKRIVNVSSIMGSLTLWSNPDVYTGPNYLVYPSSKTAENALTAFYGIQLGGEGFTVTSLCPGYCDTNFTGGAGTKPAENGADPIILAIESKKEDVHMKFLHTDGNDGRYEGKDGQYPW